VHIYSGIPNRAFVLCAIAFGGHSWEKAGQIWFQATTTHRHQIPPKCTFIQFADVIVDTAAELYGDDAAKLVRAAWNEVGVKRRH
jgi:Zn-dependent metalloprotease